MRKAVLLLFYAFFFMLLGRNLSFLPTLPSSEQKKEVQGVSSAYLKDPLLKFLKHEKGSFSIYYKDLKTGEEFGIDEHKFLTGASLNKVEIISYLYHLAGEGKVNLNDTIVVQKEDIQDYGTGSLRYEKPGKSYTIRRLAQLSLEQSDNTAARLIALRIGKSNVQKYIDGLGLTSTQMEENRTTALDTAKLLTLLYERKITNDALTREVLDYMKDTDFEDRLAKYIGDKANVYHKIGDAVRMVHDGGIIEDSKGPFILVVMTSDIESEEIAKDTIGKIARFVYEQRGN